MAVSAKRLSALLMALAALGAVGCGDSENASSTKPIKPELTVPDERISDAANDEDEGTTDETSAQTDTQSTTSPDGDTGGAAPDAAPQDSPANDTPPPANSPADTYEQFCRENPGACGD